MKIRNLRLLLPALVFAGLAVAGCEYEKHEPLPEGAYGPSLKSIGEDIRKDFDEIGKAHERAGKEIDGTVGQWGRDFAKGWSEKDARRKRSEAPETEVEPPPVSECEWAEFGPCGEPPPPEWFFAESENNTTEE